MLNLVDNLVAKLLDTGWTTPPAKPEFFFTIPDAAWLARVKGGQGLRLNIYLYEVRENRDFRRASWDNVPLANNTVALSQPPVYLDCHYLISAWSPTEDSDLASPVPDEHQVLSEAMRVLLRNPDVVPAALPVAGGGQVFQNAHVYLSVVLPEPARILNDFWSTMKLPWRPAVMLVVTAPLDLLLDSPPTPLLTTFIQRFMQIGSATVEELIDIGGLVLKASNQEPIFEALVERVGSTDNATTDAQGRFVFTGLQRGIHTFRASAKGFGEVEQDIDVPAGLPATHIFKLVVAP
jgi:Pvc16 N-terminal domain/Carboxypeptidase regulatory-like domain